jgi:PAS domain S-box-containing protein
VTRTARPPDDLGRVRALADLQLMDTPAEERFDRITRLAARLLAAPIAVISLVDAERQWTKSWAGRPLPETGRDGSFGDVTISAGELLVVADALADERFSSQPVVVGEPGIRFYAGHPLRAPGGQPVGVLAVMDVQPRQPRADDLTALADLARVAERELGRSVAGSDHLELRSMQDLVLRLSTLLNQTNEAVVVVDEAGIVHFWSKRAAEVYGRQRYETLGHPVEAAITTDSAITVPEIMAAVRDSGAWEGELLHKGADGRQRLMASRWRLIRDPVLSTRWIVSMARDVTADRQREQLVASQARLLDVASDTIIVRRLDGVITFWNQGAEQTLGYARDEAVGKVWHHLLQSDLPAPLEELEAQLLTDGHWEGMVAHRADGGREVRVSARWVLVRDANNRPDSVLQLDHDITELSTALEELRALEERQRVILDHSPDVVLLYLPDGTLLHANGLAREVFDLDDDGLLTRGLASLSPDTGAPALAAMTAELQRTRPIQGELRMKQRDGTTFLAEYTSAEISGPGGVPTIVTYIRDITERNRFEGQLRASERRFRTIFNEAPAGIAQIATDGRLFDANPRACSMLGVGKEEIVVSSLSRFFPPDDQHSLLSSFEAAVRDPSLGGSTVTQQAVRGDGSRVWLQVTSTPIRRPDGTLDHILIMLEDVTAKRAAEASATATLAELERINILKSEFISVVSHEFRTALAGIQGFSEMIRDEDLDKAEMKEFAGDINKDALRLNRMITEMLDLDRIEAGRVSLRLSNVDLNTAITDSIERARATSPAHSIVADLDPLLPTLLADGDRLVQVVTNLLNNAVKYSPDGGEIRVRSQLTGSQTLVSVSDQGQGIPEDYITRIFERYERYEASATSRIMGTGLGLPIARQIVEMHGGRIWVESTPGAGSTFHFTIPIHKL